MPATLYRYQPVSTSGPDGSTVRHRNTEDNEIIEVATVNGWAYIATPEGVALPEQPVEIDVAPVTLDDDMRREIAAVSPHCRLIGQRVVEMIRDRYSQNDEIKMLRIAPSEESTAYNDYVEECRTWGRAEKAKLGL